MLKPPFALPSELTWRTLLAEEFVLLAPKSHGRAAIPDKVAVLTLGDDAFYREVGLVQRESRPVQSATLQFADCLFTAAGAP